MSVVHVVPRVEDGSGSGTLPFAFRNNTSEGISHVDWTGTARSGGSIVATGSTIPAQVQRWCSEDGGPLLRCFAGMPNLWCRIAAA